MHILKYEADVNQNFGILAKLRFDTHNDDQLSTLQALEINKTSYKQYCSIKINWLHSNISYSLVVSIILYNFQENKVLALQQATFVNILPALFLGSDNREHVQQLFSLSSRFLKFSYSCHLCVKKTLKLKNHFSSEFTAWLLVHFYVLTQWMFRLFWHHSRVWFWMIK